MAGVALVACLLVLCHACLECMAGASGQQRGDYTPYKVANPRLEFSTSMPRPQRRPSSGEGGLGAPLPLGTRRAPPIPLGQGDDRGSSRTPSPSTPGDAEPVCTQPAESFL